MWGTAVSALATYLASRNQAKAIKDAANTPTTPPSYMPLPDYLQGAVNQLGNVMRDRPGSQFISSLAPGMMDFWGGGERTVDPTGMIRYTPASGSLASHIPNFDAAVKALASYKPAMTPPAGLPKTGAPVYGQKPGVSPGANAQRLGLGGGGAGQRQPFMKDFGPPLEDWSTAGQQWARRKVWRGNLS